MVDEPIDEHVLMLGRLVLLVLLLVATAFFWFFSDNVEHRRVPRDRELSSASDVRWAGLSVAETFLHLNRLDGTPTAFAR